MEKIKLQGIIDVRKLAEAIGLTNPTQCTRRLTWFLNLDEAELQISGEEASKFAEEARRYRRSTACKGEPCHVFVLATKDITYGTMRMLQFHLEDIVDIQIFRDRSAVSAKIRDLDLPFCA